mmetsp:Transcript_10672/g.22199  ORF Transcript_10672/g.22199 Transcript_10672/m.22199 type:complete len:214 (-) Transcript_10672:2874-3515(-)
MQHPNHGSCADLLGDGGEADHICCKDHCILDFILSPRQAQAVPAPICVARKEGVAPDQFPLPLEHKLERLGGGDEVHNHPLQPLRLLLVLVAHQPHGPELGLGLPGKEMGYARNHHQADRNANVGLYGVRRPPIARSKHDEIVTHRSHHGAIPCNATERRIGRRCVEEDHNYEPNLYNLGGHADLQYQHASQLQHMTAVDDEGDPAQSVPALH